MIAKAGMRKKVIEGTPSVSEYRLPIELHQSAKMAKCLSAEMEKGSFQDIFPGSSDASRSEKRSGKC